jgi:hypothetical protein
MTGLQVLSLAWRQGSTHTQLMVQRSKSPPGTRKRSASRILGYSAATGGVILAPKSKPKLFTVEEIDRMVRDMLAREEMAVTGTGLPKSTAGDVDVPGSVRRDRRPSR